MNILVQPQHMFLALYPDLGAYGSFKRSQMDRARSFSFIQKQNKEN